jgi:hypothetical protein
MAYSAVPSVSTGDLWTAANHNTYIRDNFSDHETRVLAAEASISAIPVNILSATRRQGGSETHPSYGGTTNYDISGVWKFQIGVISIDFSNVASAGTTITFETAYSTDPIVVVGQPTEFIAGVLHYYSITKSVNATTLNVSVQLSANATGTIDFDWFAFGPIA